MKKLMLTTLGLSLAGCCLFENPKPADVAAVSPDGKNEIRLWTDPLAYEVVRGGEIVVAKSEIGMKVDGKCLKGGIPSAVTTEAKGGTVETPVYKKDRIDLSGNETFVDFGDWGVRLAARNDGVAYRFETKMPGRIKVNCEKATVNVPDAAARSCVYRPDRFGCEENVPTIGPAGKITNDGKGNGMVYLPFTYSLADDTTVAVTDADVRDYPVWYLKRTECGADVGFKSVFAGWPKKTHRAGGWDSGKAITSGGRWVKVDEHADYLVETEGTRTFPWRAFILGDAPKSLCESDLVNALSAPQANLDFSWVKPGKVAWDWWNNWNLTGVDFRAEQMTRPETRLLFKSVCDYLLSARTAPAVEVSLEKVRALEAAQGRVRAIACSSDEAGGWEMKNACDGDPATIWHTRWKSGKDPEPPHWITFALRRDSTLKGITVAGRRDGNSNGLVKACRVETSLDGKTWQTAAEATLAKTAKAQTIPFARPVKARFVKFTALSVHVGPWAHLAEFDVVE